MTDRELLELAAKAAGIEGEYGFASDDYYYRGNTEGILTYLPDGQLYVWNPLTDDGDALRLAVGLRIVIDPEDLFNITASTFKGCHVDVHAKEHAASDHDADRTAATRRAIVRAAAKIGKAMK